MKVHKLTTWLSASREQACGLATFKSTLSGFL